MNDFHQSRGCDLFSLQLFLAVASHRSFRAAAREFDVTASAVSHSVKALEQRLAVRLLNRTTRSVTLTDAGERFAASLRPTLASLEQALQAVDDFRDGPSGTVRINASEGAVRLILRPILAKFLRTCPQVRLDIVCDGRLGDVVGEGFDAGIRLAEAVPKDMIAVPVGRPVRFAAVGSPDYFAARGRPTVPQDLLQHDCIRFRFESGAIYRWEFARHGVAYGVNVNGQLTLTDQPLMVDAALDGVGIAFVPDHLATEALREGRLERVLEEWCPEYPGLCLYYPGHRHVSGALRALIEMIRDRG